MREENRGMCRLRMFCREDDPREEALPVSLSEISPALLSSCAEAEWARVATVMSLTIRSRA